MTVTEPRFTPAETAVLLVSRRQDRIPRNEYGIPLHEAMDPANQFRYRALPPKTDWAVKAGHMAVEAYRKTYPNADLSALHFTVERIGD